MREPRGSGWILLPKEFPLLQTLLCMCVCVGGVLFKSMILRLDYQGSHPGSAPIWPYTWMRHFFSSVPQFPNLQNASNSGIYLNRLFWE